ncbi:LysR family transcriptional regulator [Pseudoclavibacter chungangensis]|uniref:LysR family transcriptional regulator n=1 Tax=Pseudoclavibacter chungangensis TaxID=587635 RepID=A0A7J5BZH7_9MICO|nr:LysR family transcriptional regulator [Pseudoclavibacter chungangensis]KAB1660067.1 LysR family transcriptional regulator [Pseudoclavibacter chungangensis]NYJ66835.1 DNA-binding transcriptional LysR family regulator [Pseudoclavibacter chungangensis]
MSRHPADLRGLTAFVAVLDTGSVAAAAALLGWSHPTVDHHLRKLELAAGVPLLERGPRGSVPSESGLRVAASARRVLDAERHVFDELDAWRRTGSSLVRLGVFPTLGAQIVPGLLAGLTGSGVALEVTLDECERLTAKLGDGSLEAAIVFQASGAPITLPAETDAELLFAEEVMIALPVGHPVGGTAVPLTDLGAFRDERWSFGASGSDTLDDATRDLCRRSGFDPETAMHSDDYAAVLRLVAAGVVVAVVPRSVARGDGVDFVPIDRALLHREVLLATTRAALATRTVDAVRAALRRVLPDIGPRAANPPSPGSRL